VLPAGEELDPGSLQSENFDNTFRDFTISLPPPQNTYNDRSQDKKDCHKKQSWNTGVLKRWMKGK
jgi:hypothetical protein